MPRTIAPPSFEKLVFGDKHQIEAIRLYERKCEWFDLPDCETCNGVGDCPTCSHECEDCEGYGKTREAVAAFKERNNGRCCP